MGKDELRRHLYTTCEKSWSKIFFAGVEEKAKEHLPEEVFL
jgi:hypothetical protein